MRDPATLTAAPVDEEIRSIDGQQMLMVEDGGSEAEWASFRPWLEYRSLVDKAFCFPCRLFAKTMSATQIGCHDVFALKGYDDWKRVIKG